MQLFFSREYLRHYRDTLSLSFPVIIGQLGVILMQFIDNLMIGKLGYVPLSAASLANGVFFIITILGIGITYAISPLVAEANASGKPATCGAYLRNGMAVGLISSILLGTLTYFSAYALQYLDQPAEDVELAFSYLQILSVSIIPMILFLVVKQFTDGLSLTRPAMYITILGLTFNTFANWLLIYGNWGFPRLELDGAGIGTLSSRTFMFVLMLFYVLKEQRFKRFEVHKYWRLFRKDIMGKILAIGFPSGLMHFFEVGAFVGAAILVGWLGSAERAAHQIAIQLASISFMMVTGISTGASIRVGNALGRKDWINVQRAGISGIVLATIFMIVCGLTFWIGKDFFPRFFVDDTIVLEFASSLMVVAALFQVFDGVQAVGIGVLRGIQDVKIPTLITLIAYWGLAIPLGIGLCFNWGFGLDGMWYSFVVSLGFAAIMLTGRFIWITNKEMKRNPSESVEKPEGQKEMVEKVL